MFSRDEMQRAIEDALKSMEGIALELYRRGREEAREELETVKRERDEWRDKFIALNQTAGELCNACGWAFRIPGEHCRCEVVKERDEARAEVEHAYREGGALYEAKIAEREAFRSGAEAMREHIAEVTGRNAALEWVVELVRALPIPEEP